MKYSFKLSQVILKLSFFLLTILAINKINSNPSKAQSINNSIDDDLREARKEEIYNRNYRIDREKKLLNAEITILPYEIKESTIPDWWSEKQAYNMSYLLSRALEQYPGLIISSTKTWDDIIVEKELGIVVKKNLEKPNIKRVYIRPFVEDYLFKALRPKKRGVGLVVIAVTNKKCITETFLSTNYQIEGVKLETDNLLSKHLIQTSTGGTSLNLNIGLGAFGGGKFKEPPKAQVKKIVYKTVVDAAEGIYCNLLDQEACKRFYKERDYNSPTVDKRRRREKVIDKSC